MLDAKSRRQPHRCCEPVGSDTSPICKRFQSGGNRERHIDLVWDNGTRRRVVVPADQADVMRQIDLTEYLVPGDNRLTLEEPTGTAPGYQVAFRYHVPDAAAAGRGDAFQVAVAYDRTELRPPPRRFFCCARFVTRSSARR